MIYDDYDVHIRKTEEKGSCLWKEDIFLHRENCKEKCYLFFLFLNVFFKIFVGLI